MQTTFGVRSILRDATPASVRQLVRKVLVWKRNAMFHPYTITQTVHGESFPFWIGDATAELWYKGQHHEWSPELAFIRDHMLSAGDLVFEVGSHHGFHTVLMARRSAQVVAIEPNPHNATILRKNVSLNGLQNVVVCRAAVGSSDGKISLLQDSREGGVIVQNPESLPTIDADLLPLDHFAQRYGFPQFLKIDVEGFEDRVLKGASQIMQRRPKIAIEVHVDWVSRYGSSVREVVGLLKLESYHVWILDHKHQEVVRWNGDDLTGYPPPKFHLFLLPRPLKG